MLCSCRNYTRYVDRALRIRRLIADDFYRVFENVDVLLTPTTNDTSPLYSTFIESGPDGYERERADDYFTQPANMAGVPAVSVPVALSDEGLPIGLQIIAAPCQERRMLSVARFIERIVKFKRFDSDQLFRE